MSDRRTRPYTLYDFTQSVCHQDDCLRRADAKIVFEDGNVFMLKECVNHPGEQKVLIATDIPYYKQTREVFLKPSEMPNRFGTPVKWGCPYDCGLCTDHQQHSCTTLIEITDNCNLTCPTCYASSSPGQPDRPLDLVKSMIDLVIRNEGEPDIVQISGGEPTIHPQFWKIMDYAYSRKEIRGILLNTNGIKIANDPRFAERLAEQYKGRLEVYLQFDSFRPEALISLRGKDLTESRQKAIDNLNRVNLPTTLVTTLQRGLNVDEIGTILEYALRQKCVKRLSYQPTQAAGRLENFDPSKDRLTLTEVRQAIIDQSRGLFIGADIVPVPCNPDSLAIAYAFKLGNEVFPLTRYISPQALIEGAKNTIMFDRETQLLKELASNEEIQEELSSLLQNPDFVERCFKALSTGNLTSEAGQRVQEALCCLPQVSLPPKILYENTFRVTIIAFQDKYNLDARVIKKSCVHIVHPDGRRVIPFETMNIFYRPGLEGRLDEIREERLPSGNKRGEIQLPLLKKDGRIRK